MVVCSPVLQRYFDDLDATCKKEFAIAQQARAKGWDPEKTVEIYLAANMAERVVGLISVVAPQIVGSGVVERIIELEDTHGKLDWRVALIIALEIAQQKFCTFKNELEAIEIGIRTGFAYGTVGIVSSPLEGLVNIEAKDRMDKTGKYLCLNFAGPIRNAGGTAASWCVIIADYVRKHMNYAVYDPTEQEIKRCPTEIEDYHERVTNLQYFPSKRESEFLMQHLPVEISGDASERFEVSNFKDLPRIPTNLIRSGYCLIHSSCIPLKAPKLWKELGKWGKDLGMEHWGFLESFVKIQKEEKAKNAGAKAEDKSHDVKIKPNYTYIADLVAGRPILAHPMHFGGFRLRYGRARTSGFSAGAVHPATMHALDDFIATGTQLKVERPGKGSAFTPCSLIEGPIVKLRNGNLIKLNDEQLAKATKKDVVEILYLGDYLVNYGDFFDRAHILVPPGYCVEWWVQELEKSAVNAFGAIDAGKISEISQVPIEIVKTVLTDYFTTPITGHDAIRFSKAMSIPLHPAHCVHWNAITPHELLVLVDFLHTADVTSEGGMITKAIVSMSKDDVRKRPLELIGCEHTCVLQESVVLEHTALPLFTTLGIFEKPKDKIISTITEMIEANPAISTLAIVEQLAPYKLRDLSGCFIGARMGRPEKAKMRKMDGSPHVLFPVGEQGGRMKSFQAALEQKRVHSDFPTYACSACKNTTIYATCETCGASTTNIGHTKREIDIVHYFDDALKRTKSNVYADLIKGVEGVINKEKFIEHPIKGILRAKHDIYVNKDGTVRYDASELPITHFRPSEVGASVERLRALGYEKDIHGKLLENPQQILEIRPQDMLLPCCPDWSDPRGDDVLLHTTQFIDDELEFLYGLPRYYNIKSREDLIGQLVIGLAPHTSAGTIFRVIGFTKTQAFFCHPMGHAAMRRDCDGDESCFFLLLDAMINFSKKYLPSSRGSTMDAPLVLTSILNPAEVDDMVFNMDIAWKYPLEFYDACLQYKMPWDVSIPLLRKQLGTPGQYEGMGFTHDTDDINAGILCSSYKYLPSMQEKLELQMILAGKIRSVDTADVAKLVIEKHFIRDIKGNLRKFSQQEFRCVSCNLKFRRPPLAGKCGACGGKILFTISEGSIVKYLEPSISLAERFNVPDYIKQMLELTKLRIEGVFGREKEKQMGLGAWFG